MPTMRPRIYVTLDEDVADAIRRIGLGTGMSQSAVIGEMINKQRDALLSLGDAMDKARTLRAPLSGALAAVLGRQEAELNQDVHHAMHELDKLHATLDEAMEQQEAGPPPGSPAGGKRGGDPARFPPARTKAAPPYINKGVRNDR